MIKMIVLAKMFSKINDLFLVFLVPNLGLTTYFRYLKLIFSRPKNPGSTLFDILHQRS